MRESRSGSYLASHIVAPSQRPRSRPSTGRYGGPICSTGSRIRRAASPLRITIRNIIASPEARAASIEATLDGLPAIAGVDPLLHEALGPSYRQSDEAIATAAIAASAEHAWYRWNFFIALN